MNAPGQVLELELVNVEEPGVVPGSLLGDGDGQIGCQPSSYTDDTGGREIAGRNPMGGSRPASPAGSSAMGASPSPVAVAVASRRAAAPSEPAEECGG
jgi:hypothetical protein